MDSTELVPLGKEVHAHLTVEELGARFEAAFLHLDFAMCRKRGGCLTPCRKCGGGRPGRQSSSADDHVME
jgi:hypothetical protein